ncbi:MAG: gliding motility-associated peptidyl-prolyl isomerase GldI [Bacteroidia bacterium]|nr:gliding motility-associated peptidyl-prolyl isomerase GldI [Bacteroidia bacterium]NNK70144.1 gliding motility-associated peptidyl-prolyl isomerase GldI [Flavobacteriaceae bacterium]
MKNLIPCIAILLFFGCKSPEARYPVSHKSGSFIKASAERNKQLNKQEQEHINTIMAEQPDIEFIASENGFWYYYNTRIDEDTIKPKYGDVVNYNYNIKDLSGQTIYSQKEMDTLNYTIDQEELFMGLREGLKLMKAGETVTFYFPSQIAYGYYGDENRIGTNIPLVCKVTVNSIYRKENNK